MVVLNRIYTKPGDAGTTALGTGERRRKDDLRIETYGTVDEANSAIGLARVATSADPKLAALDAMLARIQNDLFDLGADLCAPDQGKPLPYEPLRIVEALGRKIGISRDRVADDIRYAGNTSSASIPLALARMTERGELTSGSPVLLMGYGAGMCYAAQVITVP